MKRLSLLTLIFQDAVDVLTPLVLLPIYWLMFKGAARGGAGLADETVFMVMSAFWAAGQGRHLSANSLNDLIGNLSQNQVIDVTGTDL